MPPLPTPEELDPFLQTAIEAARRAGDVLEHWAGRFSVSEKGPSDVVTEADIAAQAVIVDLVSERFPDHNLLGEESLARTGRDSPFRWIIDPLDGTSNYVHGFPYYAVSIGLEYDAQPLVGVIYDPNRRELFQAVRGRGAELNGRPLKTTATADISRSMLVASLPVAAKKDDPMVRRFLETIGLARSVQRTGSAALNLAYVAAGRIDGFWSGSLKPWDAAAGVLLVTEAGGAVTGMSGHPFRVDVPDLLASNGTALHGRLVELLSAS